MYDQNYLHYFDDRQLAEEAAAMKKAGFTLRQFAEYGYIPMFLIRKTNAFLGCLDRQGARFLRDLYCRCHELYAEPFPFGQEQFRTEQHNHGQTLQLRMITLPQTGLRDGDFAQIAILSDTVAGELYVLAVQKAGDGRVIHSFNLRNRKWTREADAPDDPEALEKRILELTVHKNESLRPSVSARCPLCGRNVRLRLTEAEMAGYRRFREEDVDLADAVGTLHGFEREFLLTGMCPDCQSGTFRTDLPGDLSRWEID